MLKVVFFDLWNTLIENRNYSEFRIRSFKDILEKNGYKIEITKLKKGYTKGFEYSSKVIKSENYRHVKTKEIVEKVLENLNLSHVSITEELVTMYEEAILFDPPILKKNVKKILQKIDGKFKIGMISVTGVSPGKHVREILEDYKIKDFFDVLIFSDEVGYVKPSQVLFTKALNMLNVESNQCVHIGDSLNGDIKGAQNVGMKTVWIKTENKNYTKINPDYIITDLSELPKILDNF